MLSTMLWEAEGTAHLIFSENSEIQLFIIIINFPHTSGLASTHCSLKVSQFSSHQTITHPYYAHAFASERKENKIYLLRQS